MTTAGSTTDREILSASSRELPDDCSEANSPGPVPVKQTQSGSKLKGRILVQIRLRDNANRTRKIQNPKVQNPRLHNPGGLQTAGKSRGQCMRERAESACSGHWDASYSRPPGGVAYIIQGGSAPRGFSSKCRQSGGPGRDFPMPEAGQSTESANLLAERSISVDSEGQLSDTSPARFEKSAYFAGFACFVSGLSVRVPL